jgi:lysyl-tRNA synthetase class 2
LFIKTFLESLIQSFGGDSLKAKLQKKDWIRERTVEESFIACTKSGFEKKNLISLILKEKLTNSSKEVLETWPYEDLFFLVFLNLVEPKLGEGIVFLYDYPPECAALARVDQGVAQRFEIYWDGLELANAFFELKDPSEQRRRFLEEQNLRNRLGKEVFPLDEDFLNALGGEFPDVSGISIGMDRLILRLLEFQKLKEISPYWI